MSAREGNGAPVGAPQGVLSGEHALIAGAGGGIGPAVPPGRMGVPEDIAGATVFLASPAAACNTAQTLNVDGGNVMS